jgi:Mg2+/citrate symporter
MRALVLLVAWGGAIVAAVWALHFPPGEIANELIWFLIAVLWPFMVVAVVLIVGTHREAKRPSYINLSSPSKELLRGHNHPPPADPSSLR